MTKRDRELDVIIVGGGPNGLTAAAYLARSGAHVLVLEKRFEWGGTLATDDYSTPFLWNIAQFLLPLGEGLPPVRDLSLKEQGLSFIEPDPPIAFIPADGGEAFTVGRRASELGDGLAAMIDAAESAIMPLLYREPCPVEEAEGLVAREAGAERALALAALTPSGLVQMAHDASAGAILRYACLLNGFLEEEPLGLIGAFAVAKTFRPAIVRGGSKSLANALFRAGAASGARYLAVADVVAIEPDTEGVIVRCRDRRVFTARAVVSTLDPVTTFARLLPTAAAPSELRARAEAWRCEPAGFFTAHFGIKGGWLRETGGRASRALLQIIGYRNGDEIAEQVAAAIRGELPREPAGHLTVTSDHDPSQASRGPFGPLHTLRFQTLAPPRHPAGSWASERADYRSRCWRLIRDRADGALGQARLLFEFSDTPEDIEKRFRTTRNGSLRHGKLSRDQTLIERPDRSCSSGRTPIPGLYLGGSSVHPGLPGTLAEGYRVAGLVSEDLGLSLRPARDR